MKLERFRRISRMGLLARLALKTWWAIGDMLPFQELYHSDFYREKTLREKLLFHWRCLLEIPRYYRRRRKKLAIWVLTKTYRISFVVQPASRARDINGDPFSLDNGGGTAWAVVPVDVPWAVCQGDEDGFAQDHLYCFYGGRSRLAENLDYRLAQFASQLRADGIAAAYGNVPRVRFHSENELRDMVSNIEDYPSWPCLRLLVELDPAFERGDLLRHMEAVRKPHLVANALFDILPEGDGDCECDELHESFDVCNL